MVSNIKEDDGISENAFSLDEVSEKEKEITNEFVKEFRENDITGTDYEVILYFEKEVLGRVGANTLLDTFDEILSYSYLLFPPVYNQDISRCISEPRCIVREPFSTVGPMIINLEEARTSLLETIINIRLDKVTGLNYEKVRGVLVNKKVYKMQENSNPGSPEFTDAANKEITFDDFVSDRSSLESIIANRLYKSFRFRA